MELSIALYPCRVLWPVSTVDLANCVEIGQCFRMMVLNIVLEMSGSGE